MPIFAGQNRAELRRLYLSAWRKAGEQHLLEPLEAQLVDVIRDHPEYVHYLEGGEQTLQADFPAASAEENPFLHMGLHLALRELVSTDRPHGVAAIHRELCTRYGDVHAAEHAMLGPLAETLWEAQTSGRPPDEQRYLRALERLTPLPHDR